jgi:hypothetical protein
MLLGEEIRTPARRARRVWALRGRINDIAGALGVSRTLIPSDQSGVDRLHAFRLLAHSEVQAYLDDLTTLLLDRVEDRSRVEGLLTHAGHHLLVYYAAEPLGSPRNASNAAFPPFATTAATALHAGSPATLEVALKRHRGRARDNSAVKGGSIKRLLLPLGYRQEMLSTPLLAQLDSLGDSRNQVAHRSGIVGTSPMPTGSAEWTRFQGIMPGLELLERYAPRLLRAADA